MAAIEHREHAVTALEPFPLREPQPLLGRWALEPL
jgi:hypothetical protein